MQGVMLGSDFMTQSFFKGYAVMGLQCPQLSYNSRSMHPKA